LVRKGKRLLKKILKIIYIFHLFLAVLVFLVCLVYSNVNPKVGTLMLYREIKNRYKVQPVEYISINKIPRQLKILVVAAEDSKFYEHWGVDPEAISEALSRKDNLKKKYYGASTITQQLARTLFLLPDKNFFRKYMEIFIAVEMDILLQKEKILELYLNSIEWGKGIFGIKGAAEYYYGKGVSELSMEEMVELVTILPNPIKYGPGNFMKRKLFLRRYEFLASVAGLTNQEWNDDNQNGEGITNSYDSFYIEEEISSSNEQNQAGFLSE